MTHRELLENALLDVLQMLDDDEQAAFNEAFEAAPPHLQAQVRREQTRFAKMESLLPDVSPPASLRARVVEAVRAAIAGRQIAEAESALQLHDPDAISRLPAMAHRRKVAAMWRAAAFGCAAAAIVLGITTVRLQGMLGDIRSQEDMLLSAMRDKFGPEYLADALVDESTQRITLTGTDAALQNDAKAAVWFNPGWQTAKLFGINLPATTGSKYKLVVVDENDEPVSVIAEFVFTGGLLSEEVPITVALDAERLAIVSGAESEADSVLLGVPEVLEH
ncbi:hypothetical protein MNBD_PLANCTO03-634 [hydrothermal vent metagenome]|uniref:Anti-sigma factor n=1 Tax=hydrothermal vent metagenome TaxID=652676 RepID=A0A3B1DSJ6_9ZZZZ